MIKIRVGYVLFFLVGLLLFSSCGGGDTPTTPAAPAKPACETNHTATIRFQNQTTRNLTYDIIFDGSRVATIGPGTTSQTFTVNAGTHTILFKVTNTNITACYESSPNIAQCSDHTYSCNS